MSSQGIKALKRRTYKATTDSNPSYSIARDYVRRNFNPTGPSPIWVSDLTYIRVGHLWMYLTIVMDLWGREIVGWSFSRTMKTHETTISALRMAIKQRGVHHGLIFHSDRSVQYADKAFRKLCAQHRILRSMNRKGDCWDKAVAESFFKTLNFEAFFWASHCWSSTSRNAFFLNGLKSHTTAAEGILPSVTSPSLNSSNLS
jgi:transposase InsO family protein